MADEIAMIDTEHREENFENESKEKNKKISKNQKQNQNQKPNVFVSLQVNSHLKYVILRCFSLKVDNPEIHKAMDCFQQSCLEHDPRLRDFLVPVRKAHITLLVMHVSKERLEEAKDLFITVIQEKIVGHFDKDDVFEVTFECAGSFNGRVVYAEPQSNTDRMIYMNQELYKAFSERGFACESNFSPHITLLKKGYKKGNDLEEVPPVAYANMNKTYFGIQEFSGIQLLSMSKPQTKKGYYFCETEHNFEKKTPLENAIKDLEKKKEIIRMRTRDSVRNVLSGSQQEYIGFMVAGMVAGAAVANKD